MTPLAIILSIAAFFFIIGIAAFIVVYCSKKTIVQEEIVRIDCYMAADVSQLVIIGGEEVYLSLN